MGYRVMARSHTILDGLDITPMVGIADIVRDLLETEYDRLLTDHYGDDVTAECDGCRKAAIIGRTLATVISVGGVESINAAACVAMHSTPTEDR